MTASIDCAPSSVTCSKKRWSAVSRLSPATSAQTSSASTTKASVSSLRATS